MVNFEKYIEDCYLDKINLYDLQMVLGLAELTNYLFAKKLLDIAEIYQNSDAVHLAFLIFDDYELKEEDFNILDIFFFSWHDAHEDIVFTISKIKNCKLVDFFHKAIFFVPDYLIEDDLKALARKAFFGLGNNIKCPKVVEYLKEFEIGEDELLAQFSREQLSIHML